MKRIICAIVLLTAGVATADKTNIVLRSGESITNATISRVEPDGITLMYGCTICKYAFRDLSDTMQQQFNYNPTNAAEYAAKSAGKRQDWARRVTEDAKAKAAAEAKENQAVGVATSTATEESRKTPGQRRASIDRLTKLAGTPDE